MHAYLLLMSLALGYSLPGPTKWTAVALQPSTTFPPASCPRAGVSESGGGGSSFFPSLSVRGGGTVPALSPGDSGVTERGVPRPLPSLLAASAPPTAASFFFFFFFFSGVAINAELIKPQLIASVGEEEGEREGEGGREGGTITALAFTDLGTEGRTRFGWPPPRRRRLLVLPTRRSARLRCLFTYLFNLLLILFGSIVFCPGDREFPTAAAETCPPQGRLVKTVKRPRPIQPSSPTHPSTAPQSPILLSRFIFLIRQPPPPTPLSYLLRFHYPGCLFRHSSVSVAY